jgi:hypothetical protein
MVNVGGKSESHWLLKWTEEFDVATADDAIRRLRVPDAVDRIYSLAQTSPSVTDIDTTFEDAIIAGPEMDHPYSNCNAPRCRIPIVENEFGQLLQFFDGIVMEGPPSSHYRALIEMGQGNSYPDELAYTLHQDLSVLLHMKRIGLTRYITFADKVKDDDDRLHQCAESLDLDYLMFFPQREQIAMQLSRESEVTIKQLAPDHWYGFVSHPLFGGSQGAHFSGKYRPKKYEVIDAIILRLGLNILSDVASARSMSLPLAPLTEPAFFSPDGESGRDVSVEDVALALKVPALQGLGTRGVIALREQEPEHFERYRSAVKTAIRDVIAARHGTSPTDIAQAVWRDSLVPEVADIGRKLKASRKGLAKTVATGASVGSIMVGIGELGSLSWLLQAGIATAATPLVEVYRYFANRQTLEISDMYFLWKAMRKHRPPRER